MACPAGLEALVEAELKSLPSLPNDVPEEAGKTDDILDVFTPAFTQVLVDKPGHRIGVLARGV
jgi:hypothetical protein